MIRVGGKVMFWSFLLHWLTPLPLFLAYDFLSIEGEGKATGEEASSTRTYAWCRPYQHVHVLVVAIGPKHLGSIHPYSTIHSNSSLLVYRIRVRIIYNEGKKIHGWKEYHHEPITTLFAEFEVEPIYLRH